MEQFLTLFVGFALGLLTNWFFWKTLQLQKPKVVISPKIAVELDRESGRRFYRFKLLNEGPNQVIDITFKAWIAHLVDRPGGKVSKGKHILPTHNSPTMTLASKGDIASPWDLSPWVFLRIEGDHLIEDLLDHPDTRVLVTLRATDALSGATIVQQKTFTSDALILGQFPVGEGMEVVSTKP